MGLWQEILKSALIYLTAIALGAVVTSLQWNRRMQQFEHDVVKPLRDDVATLKATTVTRAELERDMKQLRDDMKEWIGLLRADIKDLAAKLDRRN